MSRLLENIKSDYFKAINSLKPKKTVKTIRVYYELFLYSYNFEKQRDNSFTRDDFSKVIKFLEKVNLNEQGKQAIEALIHSVNNQLNLLKNKKPPIDIHSIAKELKTLGVNENNTYLFVKGHIIYDNVVLMFLKPLDNLLKKKKFEEFKASSFDKIRTEKIKQYKAQITDIENALRMNTNYYSCFLMKKIERDVRIYLANIDFNR
jgi:ribosomal protein L18E